MDTPDLTLSQAARRAGSSTAAFAHAVRRGAIKPAGRTRDGRLRFCSADVDAYAHRLSLDRFPRAADWLPRAMADMVRCRTVRELLDLAYDAIRRLGYDRVGIDLVDSERHALVEYIGTDAAGHKFYPRNRVVSLDSDAFIVRMLADPRMQSDGPGFIYLVDATRELPPGERERLDGCPKELLFVALRTAGTVLGYISVDNLTSGRPLSPARATPLVAFAAGLAATLDNVRLLEGHAHRIDILNANLQRRMTELEWLRDISRRLTETRSRAEVLDIVYDSVRAGLGYDRVGINLFDHEAGVFEDCIGTDAHGNKICPMDRLVGLDPDSPLWRFPGIAALLQGAEYYYTTDAYAECPPELRYLFDGAPTHNLMVPLRSGERVTGMISVDNLLSGRPIVSENAGPLLAISNQVATAVENARLQECERVERAQLAVTAERLHRVYATMACGVLVRDVAGLIVDANDAAHDILGQPPEGLLGRSLDEVVIGAYNEDGRPLSETRPLMWAFQSGQPQRGCVMDVVRADGERRWLQVDAVPVLDAAGQSQQVVLSFTDITARKNAEDTLRRSEARLGLQYATAEILARSGTRESALLPLLETIGIALDWDVVAFWGAEPEMPALCLQSVWQRPDSAPTGIVAGEKVDLCNAGVLERVWSSRRPAWINGNAVDAGDLCRSGMAGGSCVVAVPVLAGETAHGVLQMASKADRALDSDALQALATVGTQLGQFLNRLAAEEAVAYQAWHDALTGLPNRALLQERLEQALLTAQRNGAPLALLLMDLDRFKEVNDTLGHAVGDRLLQEVSARLRAALRRVDTAARLGGDEFALLLPETDAAGAEQVARLLLRVLEAPIVLEGQAIDVGASVGIAVHPEHGTDASALLRCSDVAMYVAKRRRCGYAFYTAADDQHTPDQLALTGALRQALTTGGLALHYQPLVDLDSGSVRAVEALVRWVHPERGFILPDQFIPLAEHTGLIGLLTDWVIETAVKQCRQWEEDGLMLDLQVNLSMRDVQDELLPERVAGLIRRYRFAPERLTLEITEGALMAELERARSVLTRLAALGMRLAIDDFGAGYSSLGYIKDLPIHEVKIDKSFVLHMDTQQTNAALVQTIIAMARILHLDVVAEGVESVDTCALLRAMGCSVAQGYYLSKPLPAYEIAQWTRSMEARRVG